MRCLKEMIFDLMPETANPRINESIAA